MKNDFNKKALKKLFVILLILASSMTAQPKISKIASMPGAFSRMGFGPRGIAMGNALSSVSEGNLTSYYNPALSVMQSNAHLQASYSALTFDRHLNFVGFTKKFNLGHNKKTGKPISSAGLSIGIINSGVSNISGRDNQGFSTGDLSTSENQFFASISKKFGDKISAGISMKFYYYKLYEKMTATSFGLDLGLLYRATENLNFSLVVVDVNSSYKWDSSSLYDLYGRTSNDDFPWLAKFGTSYYLKSFKTLIAVEYERSSVKTNYLRGGVEYSPVEKLFLRAGIDRLNISNFDEPALFSFGFEYTHTLLGLEMGMNYAFVIEHYSTGNRHVIGIILNL